MFIIHHYFQETKALYKHIAKYQKKIYKQSTLDFLYAKNTMSKTLAQISQEQMSLFYHSNIHQMYFIEYPL